MSCDPLDKTDQACRCLSRREFIRRVPPVSFGAILAAHGFREHAEAYDPSNSSNFSSYLANCGCDDYEFVLSGIGFDPRCKTSEGKCIIDFEVAGQIVALHGCPMVETVTVYAIDGGDTDSASVECTPDDISGADIPSGALAVVPYGTATTVICTIRVSITLWNGKECLLLEEHIEVNVADLPECGEFY